jgi:hypothetical protein
MSDRLDDRVGFAGRWAAPLGGAPREVEGTMSERPFFAQNLTWEGGISAKKVRRGKP